jgi:hypothetical protein
MPRRRGGKYLIPLIILAVILLFFAGPSLRLLDISGGYSSAYEGAKATFLGLVHNGVQYTAADTHGASVCRILGTQLNFDPDAASTGLPNLAGEMTTIFIPEKVSVVPMPSWVPRDWTNELAYIGNPVNAYTWSVVASDSRHDYRMEEWLTKWYVNVEAKFDSSAPFQDSEGDNQRYVNTEIWFKIDTAPTWYFQNQTSAYFAIAKIYLNKITLQGKDIGKIDVTPEASGSAMYISYSPFSTGKEDESSTFTGYYYGKTLLNSAYFRPTVYTNIILGNFGTQSWWEWASFYCKADVVAFDFTVKQFVVGEWVVKDIQKPNDDMARKSQVGGTAFYIPIISDLAAALANFLGNPFGLASAAIFVFLLILALVALVLFWFFGRPREWKKKNE